MEKNKVFTWPIEVAAVSSNLRVAPLNSVNSSPFNGGVKALNVGQMWMGSFSFPAMSQVEAQKLQSFLDQVRGPANIVRMLDWTKKAPYRLNRDTISNKGEPWDDGTYFDDGYGWSEGYSPMITVQASKGDTSITVDGLPASTTVLGPEDNFEINKGLYNLTGEATTDASGSVTIEFQPPLRSGVAVGDVVILDLPRCEMRLTKSSNDIISQGIVRVEPFTISFTEDVK